MKTIRRVSGSLCILLTLVSVVSAADVLKLATYNCEFLVRKTVHTRYGMPLRGAGGSPEDREFWKVAENREKKFQEAVAKVAHVIAKIDADVIALGEVGDAKDVRDLVEAIKKEGVTYTNYAICDSDDSFTMQRVAVLSKFKIDEVMEKIPGRESYDTELDDAESEDETGISKGMRVAFTAYKQRFYLYVVHLKSEGGGHEADAQRIAQGSIVRRHYLPLLEAGEHVIVAGDLNDAPGQPVIRRIRGRDDIYGDLIRTGDARYFPDDKLDTRWTYEYQGVREQIDHILLSDSIKDACVRGRGIQSSVYEYQEGEEGASDHRPFIVTLNLRENQN